MSEPQKKQRIVPFDENDTFHPLKHFILDLVVIGAGMAMLVIAAYVVSWAMTPLPA